MARLSLLVATCLFVAAAHSLPQHGDGGHGGATCAPCHVCPCHHPDIGKIEHDRECKHCLHEPSNPFCGFDGRIYLNKCWAICYKAHADHCGRHCDHANCRQHFPDHFGGK